MLATMISRTPPGRYRHVLICLTGIFDPDFELAASPIPIFCLNKRPGHDPVSYMRLYRLLRRLRPAILHTRNIGTVDGQFIAWLAGVPARIHGAHGRDIYDLDGSKYLWLRRAMMPFIDRYIAVSRDLGRWLIETAAIPSHDLRQIYNGVDTDLFRPRTSSGEPLDPLPAAAAGKLVIGTVERLQSVKDPLNLIHAFVRLLSNHAGVRDRVHLLIVGDGPLRQPAENLIQDAGIAESVTMAGKRTDIPHLMRSMDIFVLPSMAEGTSNTILEAMATALPVVATDVGGNPELVTDKVTGTLVPARDPESLAAAILRYVDDAQLRRVHGQNGRRRILSEFSLASMTESYLAAYDGLLSRRRRAWIGRAVDTALSRGSGQAIKSGIVAAARYTGANRMARRSRRDRLTVLCYHSVVQAEHPDDDFVYRNAVPQFEFERQLSRIKEWFTPISLSLLIDHLYHGRALPEAPALVTFDDGYRNNLTNAAPVLKKLGVPALFLVTTGYIGTANNLWANDIDLRILGSAGKWIPAPGPGGAMLVPAGIKARQDLACRVRACCKRLPAGELQAYLARLEEATGPIDRSGYAELFEFLSWEDVRRLACLGFEIGSHTVTHPILSYLPDGRAMSELRESRLRIEREIGAACHAIAYPNGSTDDYREATLQAAKNSGYLIGFSLNGGRGTNHPFAVDRINVPGHVRETVFDAVVSGSYEYLPHARKRSRYD